MFDEPKSRLKFSSIPAQLSKRIVFFKKILNTLLSLNILIFFLLMNFSYKAFCESFFVSSTEKF